MTYFDTPIPRSAVVQRRVLSFAENAQDDKVDELAIASLRWAYYKVRRKSA